MQPYDVTFDIESGNEFTFLDEKRFEAMLEGSRYTKLIQVHGGSKRVKKCGEGWRICGNIGQKFPSFSS